MWGSLLRWFSVLVLAMLMGVPAAAAFAAPAVTAQAVAGFEGRAKAGKWVPVEITITNAGVELQGAVQFEVEANLGGAPGFHKGLYETPVVVPPGATKRLTVELPTDLMAAPALRLVGAGGETVAEIPYQLEETSDVLVGVLGVEPGELPALGGARVAERAVRLIRLDPERLPADPILLESLDAVLLDRFNWSELPAQKQRALQDWVEQGGTLIAAAGPEAKRLEGLAPWISLPLGDVQTVSVAGVGTGPIAVVEPNGGWTVESQVGSTVLAARQEKGRGSVHTLAFDPALEPFASWRGLPALVTSMADLPPQQWPGGGMPQAMGINMALADSLNQFPMREIPSSRRLLVVLGVYALVIGPVHFLLLRGLRRLGWAMLTLPVLVAAGGAGVWAYTKSAHASDLLVNTVSVLEAQPGAGALRVRMLSGFFTPPGASHRVAAGHALLTPVPPTYMVRPDGSGSMPQLASTFSEGRQAQLGAKAEWGMQAVSAEAVVPIRGTVAGALTVDAQEMTGRLTSHLPFRLEDTIVVSGTGFLKLGDLEPGATVGVALLTPAFAQEFEGEIPLAEVLMRASQFDGGPGPGDYKIMRRQQVGWAAVSAISWVRSASQPPAVLMGWTDYQALPVTVDGRKVAAARGLALYVQPLPVSLAAGEFALPASMVPGRIVDYHGMAIQAVPGWNMAQGEEAIIEFTVPVAAVGRATEVEVKIPPLGGPPGGQDPLEYYLYRWADGSWQKAAAGGPAFIGPGGVVRVKAVQVMSDRIPLGRPGLAVRGRGVTP
ncbi:MAG TPA: hypothetical protein VD969_20060 [Symbiobacteriaceae bacterium]|nr:hypothetical protein [Symbiobacteriaceae bacterium]